jgi:hypothetical protein
MISIGDENSQYSPSKNFSILKLMNIASVSRGMLSCAQVIKLLKTCTFNKHYKKGKYCIEGFFHFNEGKMNELGVFSRPQNDKGRAIANQSAWHPKLSFR